MYKKISVALAAIFLAGVVSAEQTDKPWSWGAEFGFVSANGNTDTQSLTLKLTGDLERGQWIHHGEFSTYSAEEDGSTTAEKYFVEGKTKFLIEKDYYFYGLANYEDDRFSGFDYEANLSGGFGKRFFTRENWTLDGEAGIGYRLSETDAGDDEDEAVVRLAGDFNWEISETSSFQQKLSTEIGEDRTVSKAVSALSAQINSALSMKASYEIKHSSEVPAGSHKTDTLTKISLVYKF